MKQIKFWLFISAFCASSVNAQNHEQELTNLVAAYNMPAAMQYYEQHKAQITHPFVVDFYDVMKNIYQNNDSAALQKMPEFLNKHYGTVIDNNYLLHLLGFCFQIEKQNLGNEIINKTIPLLLQNQNFDKSKDEILPKIMALRQTDNTNEKVQELNEVVVRGEKPLVQIKDGILTYNAQKLIENKPVTNVYEALQQLSGVREENEKLTLAGAGIFAILIDGKPSTMSAEQMYQLLKSMPANSVEKMELMYSAPPQYHVGTGAAVNIITKRGLLQSLNGQVNAGYEQKYYANYNAGASLFYNSDKIYSDFLYAFNHAKSRSGLDLNSLHTLGNQTYNIEQHNEGTSENDNHNVRAGFDYNFSENQNISAVYTAQITSKSSSEGQIQHLNATLLFCKDRKKSSLGL